jgi:hypothetical protein
MESCVHHLTPASGFRGKLLPTTNWRIAVSFKPVPDRRGQALKRGPLDADGLTVSAHGIHHGGCVSW